MRTSSDEQQPQVAICEMPGFKHRVDTNLVLVFFERQQLRMCDAKSPGGVIIRRAIGNDVRMIWI